MGNTIPAKELFRVLSDVKEFASTDTTFPMLAVVKVEATEGRLVAVATDRFVVGVSRTTDYEGGDLSLLLPIEFVKQLISVGNPRKVGLGRVGIDVTESAVLFTFPNGQLLSSAQVDVSFVNWRELFKSAQAKQMTPPAVFAINPKLVAKFAKVTGAHHHINWRTQATRPNVIEIGENFEGLIMPVRLPGGADEKILADWMTDLLQSA